MRKPDLVQFIVLYVVAWALAQVYVWTYFPSKYPFLAASFVNLVFVVANLFGTCIAMATGWAPWRDRDEHG